MDSLLTQSSKQLSELYSRIPSLACGDCWGECCVSPTLTVAEFAHMMHCAQKEKGEAELAAFLSTPLREHTFYPGNQHCRFQDRENGRCQNYEGRAAACRLHGHDVMREYHVANMEYCEKGQDPDKNLKQDTLNPLFGDIAELSSKWEEGFQEPYYLLSLNLEGWIDFYYQKDISKNRPPLQAIYDLLHSELALPDIIPKAHTTLAGKVSTIDKMYLAFEEGDAILAQELLQSLLEHFPSVGSYFMLEAEQLLKMVEEKLKELNSQ